MRLIAPEHLNAGSKRFRAASAPTASEASPIAFNIVCGPAAGGAGKKIRVEDQGRWWPGADGHPQPPAASSASFMINISSSNACSCATISTS